MLEAVSWASPLLLIPGVGLLLVSTSARFESVHERPNNGVAATSFREKSWMRSNAAEGWDIQDLLRNQLRPSENENHIWPQQSDQVDVLRIIDLSNLVNGYAKIARNI